MPPHGGVDQETALLVGFSVLLAGALAVAGLWWAAWQRPPVRLAFKYMVVCPDNAMGVEAVGLVYLNGAPDWNNKEFVVAPGERVAVTAPEKLYGARFAFWQREGDGLIVSSRTLLVNATRSQTWWANYFWETRCPCP